jgi:hypothetical protein
MVDRFTWGVVVGVVSLCLAALVSILVVRSGQAPPDLSTPDGTATAYIVAIQDNQPDAAWELLSGPEALSSTFRAPGSNATRDSFRNDVNNASRPGNRRIRILSTSGTGETAQVQVEVTNVASGPGVLFGGSSSHTTNFSLVHQGGTWRINSAPPVWELA